MRNTGVQGSVWSWCTRCTFLYPLEKLISQKGLRVCTVTCADKLDIEYRPFIIEEVLSDGAEEFKPLTPEVQWNPEELKF